MSRPLSVGPFSVDNIYSPDLFHVRDASGKCIAEADDYNAEANTRLFAASWDLLNACQRAFSQTKGESSPKVRSELAAALAKATGKTGTVLSELQSPGPWSVWGSQISDADGKFIGDTGVGLPAFVEEANAELMSKAYLLPEMVGTLQRIVWLLDMGDLPSIPPDSDLAKTAHDILAKYRGEPVPS